MRRKVTVTREITAYLDDVDVQVALQNMARVPRRCRGSAKVVFPKKKGESWEVRWTDVSDHEKNGKRARHDKVDLMGQTFGKLTVIADASPKRYKGGGQQTCWTCRCECGYKGKFLAYRLKTGQSKACPSCASPQIPEEDRKCRYCEGQLTSRSRLPFECTACNRQRIRQGLCDCGKFPFYPTKDCPRCNRKKGERPKNPPIPCKKNGQEEHGEREGEPCWTCRDEEAK